MVMRQGVVRVLVALAAGFSACAGALAGEDYRWVQYVPGGLEVRAITDKVACPSLTLDGAPMPMSVRSPPSEAYPVTVCAARVPLGTHRAFLDGVPLALPALEPKKILLIGDTGCEVKGEKAQACNDVSQWPFRVGADVSATLKPDLVLHVGDFHYRETPCPSDAAGCTGSPHGDTWSAWRADFFAPAELLLNAAPWIFVRGHHEECDKGGTGWARTIDPYPMTGRAGCMGPAKPFVVRLAGLSIVVVDTSTVDESQPNDKQIAFFRDQFSSLSRLAPAGPVWIATHRPLWSTDGSVNRERSGGDSPTLQAAALGAIPANVQAIISGHQHKFEVDAYVQDLPLQIVAGHGGDTLSSSAPRDPAGLTVGGVTVKSGFAKPNTFGFAMLERDEVGGDWTVTDYDVKGHPLGRCRLSGRSASCEDLSTEKGQRVRVGDAFPDVLAVTPGLRETTNAIAPAPAPAVKCGPNGKLPNGKRCKK
ncbi:MAG: metallophosphoesterase [Alsobacter sp.]